LDGTDRLRDRAGMAQELISLEGELDALGMTMQQGDARLLLQGLDRFGEGSGAGAEFHDDGVTVAGDGRRDRRGKALRAGGECPDEAWLAGEFEHQDCRVGHRRAPSYRGHRALSRRKRLYPSRTCSAWP